ncbi:metal-sulfur cluster assembly factor [Actinophytocola oryzae]|uniref:Metal-sulfur cluster biosynthetic enzyme n=1 Tax=Actinophytocola oryzae TaxID=502181 RepID=A0A4R7VH54_9PSEU|nr:iron-sulfur cluster assembly protein [Actinophytocola oryzae]TDV48664.1 metal-sulfur cluster biosynthetic enzyme [Actinophytocola oryzae]
MELTERVREALNTIIDPCSVVAGAPVGLVDLGLVRQLTVTPAPDGAAVLVRIGVTEPACLMGASFVVRAKEVLDAIPEISTVDVGLDHAADWTPDDIAPAYQLRLAEVRSTRGPTTDRKT